MIKKKLPFCIFVGFLFATATLPAFGIADSDCLYQDSSGSFHYTASIIDQDKPNTSSLIDMATYLSPWTTGAQTEKFMEEDLYNHKLPDSE